MKKIKVLHFSLEAPYERLITGGMGRFIQEISSRLQARDVEQWILTHAVSEDDKAELPLKHYSVNPLRSCTHYGNNLVTALSNTIAYTGSLAALLAKEHFDWFIIHDAPASDSVFEIARAHNVKTMLIIHLCQGECAKKKYHTGHLADYYAQQEWNAIEQCDVLATVSERSADIIFDGLPRIKEVKVFHNGVNLDRFKPIPGILKYDVLWGHRKCPQKGTDIFYNLVHARPDLSYAMCGEVSGITSLELDSHPYMVREHLLKAEGKYNLDTFGKVSPERLCEIAGQSFCFIMPTRYEPFGLVALEMMACGLPVICSGKDGLNDFCVHEENCLIVKDNRWEDYSHAIDTLKADPALRDKLVAGGFATVKRRNWDITTKELYEVIR